MVNFVFVTPTHGEIRAETVHAVKATMAHYKSIIGWVLNVGSSLLTRNRDVSVGRFLRECDKPYAILLDADMTFVPEDVEKIMAALEDGRDFVGGLCTTGDRYALAPLSENIEINGDVAEVSTASVAFTGISRRILEKMIENVKLALVPSAISRNGVFDPPYPGFFQQVGYAKNGVIAAVGEDYSFCNRVKVAGGKIWVHTGVLPGHVMARTVYPMIAKKKE